MKNYLIIIFGCLILGAVFIYVANKFAPGSYPYVERYEFDVSDQRLIDAAEKLKQIDSALTIPHHIGLSDGRTSGDLWYHIYFYIPDERRMIQTWIRGDDSSHSTLAFVAVSMNSELGTWSRINRDFSTVRNRVEKERFEKKYLKRIKELL